MATLISANAPGERRVGSVGLPASGCEVSIRDDADGAVLAGQDGEICARSPGVMSGYWHAPELAATVLANGWLHTGVSATWTPTATSTWWTGRRT